MKPEAPPFQIAKPCPKKWGDMSGDAKRRFCEHCQLHVHNLSAMTKAESEELVASSGDRLCIAYEVRDDGSMLPPSRWSWLRRIQQAAAALLAISLPMLFSACTSRRVTGGVYSPSSSKDSTVSSPDSNHDSMTVGEMAPLPPSAKKEQKP